SSPSEPSPRTPGEVLGTGDTSTSVAGTADAGAVGICKKVMSPNGRALERLRARAGDTVRFRVRVTNLGTRLLRNVRVCDRIPSGLVLVSAPGSPRLVGGRLCWTLKTLPSQRQGFATLRITRTTPGLVLNTVSVTTSNGGSARDTAGVRVLAARSSPGGVTG
ncbi:MAG TPA: hypothetical protein VNT55_19680, partial [Baekduia sp.]|nr:hypothetical protein [Baekduia sp.]